MTFRTIAIAPLIAALVGFAVGGLSVAILRARLMAALQYRHTDLWVALGRPSYAASWQSFIEMRRAHYNTFRLVWSGRDALNDAAVSRLCRWLRTGYIVSMLSFVIAFFDFILITHL